MGRPRYGPGAIIVVKGISYVICMTCHELKLGVRENVGRLVKAECRDCLSKKGENECREWEWEKREREKRLLVTRRKVKW